MDIVFCVSSIAMAMSLLGNLLMAKKNILVFPVWILSNGLWILVNLIGTFNGPMVVMYIVYIIIQVYAWKEWLKTENKKE